jgi:cell shape-determining protein MreD
MAILIAAPILALLIMIQTAVLSKIPLLQGTTDLVLVALLAWALQKRVRTAWFWAIMGGLLVGYVSALPFGAILLGYLLAVGLAVLLKQRVWQVPILAMLVATLFGTLLVNLVVIAALRIADTPLLFWEAINLVTLPSVLLNLLVAIPFYALFSDLANWLYPEPLEI